MANRTDSAMIAAFVGLRIKRDATRRERDATICERAREGQAVDETTYEYPEGTPEDPCWKAARKRVRDSDGEPTGGIYLSPPPHEWCESCQKRERLTNELRVLVQQHGGALRGLIRRGRVLLALPVGEKGGQ